MRTFLVSSAVGLFAVCALVLPRAADLRADHRADETALAPCVGLFDNIEHVFFRNKDGNIHEYYYGGDKGWFRNDLTTQANAPKAASNPTAYFVPGDKVGHIVYRATDNQIHELYHGREPDKWFHNNLSAATNAPRAAGNPCGYAVPDDNNQHIFFRSEDGSINELLYTKEGGTKGWQTRNISTEAKAPKAAGDPHAYLLPAGWMRFWKDRDRQHVLYRGLDDKIHELFFSTKDKKWQTADLSSATNAPKIAGDPLGYFLESGNTQHVVFRTGDGDVCELFYQIDARDPQWHLKNLTQEANAPKAAGEPTAYTRHDDKSEYVLYRSGDGQIQELFFSPKQTKWVHHNLSAETRAPKALGRPAANLTTKPLTQHVFFLSTDNKLCELFRANEGKEQNWHLNDLTDSVEKRQ